MSDVILIPVDLDQKRLNKSYQEVETSAESSGQETAKNFTASFNKQFTKSLGKLNLSQRLSESLFIGSTTIASLVFLEKEFKVLSILSKKLNIDFVTLVNRLERVKDSLVGITTGANGFRKIRIEVGLLLRDLGIIDSKLLGIIATIQKVQGIFTSFVGIAISVAPIIVDLERRFKIFSKLAERVGLNFEGVQESVKELVTTFQEFLAGEASLNNLKLGLGLFLQELGVVNNKFLQTITLIKNTSAVTTEFIDNAGAIAVIGAGFVPVIRNLENTKQLFRDIGKIALSPKGLFGVVSSTGTVSAGLALLAESLKGTESSFIKAIRSTALFVSILLGSFSTAIGFAIVGISQLALEIGTSLVKVSKESAKQFFKLTSEVKVLNATIEAFNAITENSVGSGSKYRILIKNLANTFNLLQSDLAKASREVIQVGSQLGLQEKQLIKLIRVAAEYAKINGKDVFDVSVALVAALNGQAQAVSALGIKLDEATLQSFAFKKGLNENFRSLASGTKVQLRYQKILKQYENVAGIASARARSLGDAQNRLNSRIEAINENFGKGTAVIEANNLAIFAANKVISGINEQFLFLGGILFATGARILQFTGFIVKLNFALFGIRKAIELTNKALQSQIVIEQFAAKLPLLGKSINQIITASSGVKTEVKDLNSLVKGLANSLSKGLLGTTGKNVSAFGALKSVVRALITNIITFGRVLIPLLAPFAIIGVKIALLVGAIVLLKNAFAVLEERTKALTGLYLIFLRILRESESILDPLVDAFKSFGQKVKNILLKAFGLLIFSIAKVFELLVKLAQKNPFGVFSKKTVQALGEVEKRLTGFRKQLLVAGLDISKLPKLAEDANRKLASVKFNVNLEELAELRKDPFGDAGFQTAQLQDQLNKRLMLVNAAVQQEIISRAEGARIIAGLQSQFATQSDDILAGQAVSFQNFTQSVQAGLRSIARETKVTGKQVASALVNGIGRGAANAFSSFGAALVKGENALKAFGKALLAAFGQALVQLGTGFILQGVAQSLAGFGSGLPLIAAGAALATFGGVLGAVAGGGGAQVSGGATGAEGSSGGFGTSPELPPLAEQQALEPETRVQVVVQGDVFDSTETGLRISQILQESALNNNVKILGGIA